MKEMKGRREEGAPIREEENAMMNTVERARNVQREREEVKEVRKRKWT